MLNLLQTFAQDTLSDPMTYESYTTDTTSVTGGLEGGALIALIVIGVIFTVVSVAALWRIFTKAGEAGWKAIVPIYNYVVLLQIVGRPVWWILFLFVSFIPFVGAIVSLVVSIIVSHDLSKSFGKDVGMTVLLVLLTPIGAGMLAWGDAVYKGPSALPGDGSDKHDDTEMSSVLK